LLYLAYALVLLVVLSCVAACVCMHCIHWCIDLFSCKSCKCVQ